MEEDGVVFFAGLELWYQVRSRVCEGDGCARVAGRCVGVETKLGQVLGWVWVGRVLGWTAAWDDERGADEVEDLVRVGVDCVGGAGEGVCVPDVDQGPGLGRC